MAEPQPLLHDACVLLSAPTQAWSRWDGGIGDAVIDGLYHCDSRVVDRVELSVDGEVPEAIYGAADSARQASFQSLIRGRPGEAADPRLRLIRTRRVGAGRVDETISVESGLPNDCRLIIAVTLHLDCTSMLAIKSGGAVARAVAPFVDGAGVHWGADTVTASLSADCATIDLLGQTAICQWIVDVRPGQPSLCTWGVRVIDEAAVVQAPAEDARWDPDRVPAHSTWLRRWVSRSLDDLSALRMTLRGRSDVVLGAGAPWFLTLFGRDALWTARFLVRFDPELALGTLRALASLQGTKTDPVTNEQPGKIVHEIRRLAADAPQGLPPVYYGTIDATPLWIILLHETWRAGVGDERILPLLPHAQAALGWMRDYATAEDGFLRYRGDDHGLANQGWKDSGDSIRWHDGSLATPPIALSEVQGYAYQAALAGADLLQHFGIGDPGTWRRWASRLKARFTDHFWIDDPTGAYPAVALDGRGAKVDSVASNMGHLLGTGLVDPAQARLIADRLVSPSLSSGFGLRTLASGEGGYWPLGYHVGSIWPHDTTIAVLGLAKEGLMHEGRQLADGLATAARGFGWRLPELWSGDGADAVTRPVPYPAACHPLTWAAAAPIAIAYALPDWG